MNQSFSFTRMAGLARWNAVLLTRNRLSFVYAVVLPLLPFLFLIPADRGSISAGSSAITTMFLIAGLFPVYYNVLSQFVNRRDELVLKRMRTGETRDSELVASIALPGAMAALAIAAVAVPIAAVLGQPLPINPFVYAAASVGMVAMFTAFAYWTAAWTRNAEAAQLTSLPIILIASIGPLGATLSGISDTVARLISWTPGAAMNELVRAGWFGFEGPKSTESTLGFSDVWGQAGEPLLVIVAWTIIGIALARRSMRWEPRS